MFFDGYLFFLLKVELGHVGFMLGAMLVGGPMALHLQQKDIDRKVDGSTQKNKILPIRWHRAVRKKTALF